MSSEAAQASAADRKVRVPHGDVGEARDGRAIVRLERD